MQLGSIDLAFATGMDLSSVLPEAGVLNIPFLFRDVGQAHAVMDGPVGEAVGLASTGGELRHTVIRIVRSSTTRWIGAPLPDRRWSRPAVWHAAGGTYQAQASDLAEGGACLNGGPALGIGDRGMPQLEGVSSALTFTVRDQADGMMHVAFNLMTAQSTALQSVLARVGQPRAA